MWPEPSSFYMKNTKCPYCKQDELKPYSDYCCCYGCGKIVKTQVSARELRNDIFEILDNHHISPKFVLITDLSEFAAKQSHHPQPISEERIKEVWDKYKTIRKEGRSTFKERLKYEGFKAALKELNNE